MSGIDIKRCTLVVQDVRRSVAFYRDTLGLALLREEMLSLGGKIVPAGLPGARAHLAVIDVGPMELGLLQWTDPPLAKPDDPYSIHLGIGDRVFVMDAPDAAAISTRVSAAHGARIQGPLHEWSVPARDGGKTEMTSLSFFDPDDFFFEIHQKRNAPNPPRLTHKRTTLIVGDLAASLAFYRDALGMAVVSDVTVPFGNALLPANVPTAKARVVVLQSANPAAGMLGLLCFLDPPLDARDHVRHHIEIGDSILVATAGDLSALQGRLKVTAGRLHAAPAAQSGAENAARSAGAMSAFDPDGNFLEITNRQVGE
jgi:catechol 2,3-dioxygenase-like lactoylglutathione lyase family enzyme